jgi:hypothetical protein
VFSISRTRLPLSSVVIAAFGGDSGEEAVLLDVGGVLQRLAQATAQDPGLAGGASFGVADCPLRDSQLAATLVRAATSWYVQLRHMMRGFGA